MEEPWYKKYKKFRREKWGKDFRLWKIMFDAILVQAKNEPYNPVTELLLNMFVDVGRARMTGKPIIMHPFNYGPEIFHAMDIEPLMQEIFSVGMAPTHANEFYIDITNQVGYGDNPTICNAQRPLIGSYMQNMAPIPDLLLFLSTPCNSLATTYQVFQYLTGVPQFNVDIPYWDYNDPNSEFYDEKTLDYISKQQKNLISWIEKKTNHKFDEDKFKQAMTWLNQARENVLEYNELLRNIPCPVTSVQSGVNFLPMITRGGTLEAVKVTKWIRDKTAENVKNGIAGVPDEQIRIAWPYTHVFFDPGLMSWLEENFRAIAIMDIMGHYHVQPHDTSTIEKCFESLAKGTLDFSMIDTCRGPAEFFIDYIIRFVRDYKINCIIIPIQFACKHAYAMLRVALEEVRKATEIPSLIVPCEPYDSRDVSSETIRGKIEDFLTEIVI
ncbi:MAG: 2-hydroxyacyl-CoA dehydratase [Candidatus Hodarchaeota archaeon]